MRVEEHRSMSRKVSLFLCSVLFEFHLLFCGFSWIKEYSFNRRPVSRFSCPASFQTTFINLIDAATLFQNSDILTPMALAGGNELQSTVAMDFVVPMLESGNPGSSLIKGIERLVREARMIFQRLEQSLRVRIVVADR